MHSPANAHLAAGHGRVIVVAPTASGNNALASPPSQAAELAAKGARVEVITPGAAAKKAFGDNPLDPGHRAAEARAGLARAAAHTEAVAAVMNS
ncbi:hypothetical protein ACFWOJ_26405 [Streptomyces sp. NPDC058439]|uniref:hypothetical protein n=1 Tax=Streptomyces sp. NPDC058439 TaxID=3346500 RepID=UPI00364A3C4D